MITCPFCDSEIDIEEDELDEGDEIVCEECGETLKVVGVDPLELEAAEEEDFEEDEDEDFFDEDEEEEEDEEDWK